MLTTFEIGGRPIGSGHSCFIIAEAGVAHFGSIDIARSLVDMAVEAKADAVKFQVFKTDRLVSSVSPEWVSRLRSKELPYEAFVEIKRYCGERGIIFFATAHEESSADFLAELDVPAFKVGSGEVNNSPFIKYLAQKGKPLIISTGLHDEKAIDDIVKAAEEGGCDEIALLHCVTAYPTPPDQANLRTITWMMKRFECPIGYSDHTTGYEIPMASIALGASVIEKHISLDRKIVGSQDSRVSCDRADLIGLVQGVRKLELALGVEAKFVAEAAKPAALWARKSVVAGRHLSAGTRLTSGDLLVKRPGTGIPGDRIAEVVGKVVTRRFAVDEVITWEDLSDDSRA